MKRFSAFDLVLFSVFMLLCHCAITAQNTIEWSPEVKLRLSDFQSPATHIGGDIISISSPAGMDFGFEMTRAQFMFTKNWNSKVNCTFNRDAASLVAPDEDIAQSLVDYAQYSFDLAELYARKFRKQLHDNKKVLTEASWARPLFDDLQKEFVNQLTLTGRVTNMGRKTEILQDLHNHVLEEIEMFPDYCKTCKPAKVKDQP